MLIDRCRRFVPALGLALAAAAQADPLDAAAPVPPLRHDSVVARHRALAEQPVAPWRGSNDTVGRIGGWRSYAREAQAVPPAAPASAPAPAHRH